MVKLAAKRAETMLKKNAPYAYPIRYAHMTRPNVAFDFFHDYKDMLSIYAIHDRFHIGGIVWHKDVITLSSLKLIESWLGCLGSYIVVFAAPDPEWYRDRAMLRSEMFSIEELVEANEKYMQIAGGSFHMPVHVDQSVYIGEEEGFPDDDVLESILDGWFERLEMVER